MAVGRSRQREISIQEDDERGDVIILALFDGFACKGVRNLQRIHFLLFFCLRQLLNSHDLHQLFLRRKQRMDGRRKIVEGCELRLGLDLAAILPLLQWLAGEESQSTNLRFINTKRLLIAKKRGNQVWAKTHNSANNRN